MTRRKKIFWYTYFLLILLMTQAQWMFPFSNHPSLLGFPTWLWYFGAVHVFFVIGLYFFSEDVEPEDSAA